MKYQYISLDRILSKLYRDLGITEISETDVIEWSGEALELIGAITLYEDRVDILDIESYGSPLPIGLHCIKQIAYNNGDRLTPTLRADCGINIKEVYEELPPQDTPADSNDYNPDFVALISRWIPFWLQTTCYRQQFIPIRLANHSFFNSVVMQEEEDTYHHDYQYTIVDSMLRVSFPKGQVAIAYYRQKVDDNTGYPMVPDEISVITAITAYVTWKYMQRLWYMGREGYDSKMQKAEEQWQWYCRQAKSKALMPQGIDDHQDMLNITNQMIPKVDRYYGFFGNLGRRDSTRWKDSDSRNSHRNIIF